jgi:hypothetical protein
MFPKMKLLDYDYLLVFPKIKSILYLNLLTDMFCVSDSPQINII